MELLRSNKTILGVYMMTLLYAFHYAIPMYATSSYLKLTFSTPVTSFLFALASLLTFLLSLHITKYIKRFHTYNFTQSILIAQFFITLGFAFTKNPFLLGFFFVSHFILTVLIYISINTFIESLSTKHATGVIRGIFLTILNLGILISPFFGGTLLARSGYEALYVISSCVLIPFMLLVYRHAKNIPEPSYSKIELLAAISKGWKDKNIRIALIAMFMLECFYAVMVIYSPLYLATLGISLPVYLTAILPIALLPLVLLPYELGILADTKIGEKELLIGGLLVLSITTMIMAITTTASIALWILILVVSRIGASCVETMSFTYYFKKINQKDIGLITLFTNIRSLATIAVPLIGLMISPFHEKYPSMIFVFLALALLYGAILAIPLKDTK